MQGTFYGQQDNQDAAGACSYSANFANSNNLAWSKGTDMTVALNDAQWAGGAGCGLCVRFRGTGAGIGTTPISTSEWKTGFVNNRYRGLCPSNIMHGSSISVPSHYFRDTCTSLAANARKV